MQIGLFLARAKAAKLSGILLVRARPPASEGDNDVDAGL